MRSVSAPPRFTPQDSSVVDFLGLPFELPQLTTLPTLEEARDDGGLQEQGIFYHIMYATTYVFSRVPYS